MKTEERILQPPETKSVRSVARIPKAWYVACFSEQLERKPLARTILGTPLVIYRGASGSAAALLDRCPHRNVPLSYGDVVGDNLQCGYHGWQFDAGGTCRAVPGLCGEPESRGRQVTSYPVREKQGLVWVWLDAESEPTHDPYDVPRADDGRYLVVRKELRAKGSVHAVIENALDVPHTAYLHAGLFRTSESRNRIDVEVRRWHDRVEAEYIGEPRPTGIVGKLLSPSGGVVTHFDRFLLPSIAQVEYAIGEENHIVLSGLCTPVTDFDTRLFAVVCLNSRIPHWAIRPVIEPLALRIFAQDAEILEIQTDTIERFGGEQYVSTDIDLLGPHIWRLMRQAERDALDEPGEPWTKSLQMEV